MKRALIALTAATAVVLAGTTSWAAGSFTDIDNNAHAANIEAVRAAGITSGCTATTYCPDQFVKRDQMATFLARAFGLSALDNDHFPVANARGPRQTYCALAAANPGSFKPGPCQKSKAVLDTAGNVGQFASVAIGSDGFPIVAYYDVDLTALDVVHCGNRACSAGNQLAVVDNTGAVGKYASLAIGPDGLPAISYFDETNTALKYIHCGSVDCASARTTRTVDTSVAGGDDNTGLWTSLVFGNDGLPFIASADLEPAASYLRTAHCDDVTCATATLRAPYHVVASHVLALARRGDNPLVFYVESNQLYSVDCTTPDCEVGGHPVNLFDNHLDDYVAGAISADGYPILAYYDINFGKDLVVQKCDQLDCDTVGTRIAVDTGTDDVGMYPSIAIGIDGLPVVAYFDNTNLVLKMIHCSKADCSGTNTFFTLDGGSTDAAGYFTSLAIGVDGGPVVAYQGVTQQELRVARPPASAS